MFIGANGGNRMLLRRVIAHLRKQEWTAIAIDFVIVVAGVFLGLQVSNWNEAAADRRAESAYLSQLQGDLQHIEGEVRDQLEFEQFQGRLAAAVFNLIQHDRSSDRSRRIGIGLSHLTVRRTLRTESPTFVDLQSSGNLEIIADPALRAEIISYFFYTRRLEASIDKNNASFVDGAFFSFMAGLGASGSPVGRSANAPNAPSWASVVTQLTWRAHVAAWNESTARRLLETTSALEARIAGQLEGGSR